MTLSTRARTGIITGAVTGALALTALGTAVANAADDPVTPNATPSTSGPAMPQRAPEEQLTGETADKVRAAVEAKYPDATIERMEKDADGQGVYEAHIVKADGTHAMVFLDADFVITGEATGGPGGPGGRGPGGPGMGTEVTGETADKVTAAVTASDSTLTVDHVLQVPDGSYVALTRKADGTKVVVKVSAEFAVTGQETLPDRGMGGPGGPGGPAAARLDGAVAQKVRKAAKERLPKATVDMLVKTPDGTYAALMTKADGTRVVVKVNKKFQVTGVEQPRMRGGMHGGAPGAQGGAATPAPDTATGASGA